MNQSANKQKKTKANTLSFEGTVAKHKQKQCRFQNKEILANNRNNNVPTRKNIYWQILIKENAETNFE